MALRGRHGCSSRCSISACARARSPRTSVLQRPREPGDGDRLRARRRDGRGPLEPSRPLAALRLRDRRARRRLRALVRRHDPRLLDDDREGALAGASRARGSTRARRSSATCSSSARVRLGRTATGDRRARRVRDRWLTDACDRKSTELCVTLQRRGGRADRDRAERRDGDGAERALRARDRDRGTPARRTSRRSCTARPIGSISSSRRSPRAGNVLFEDVPGTAKTILARSLAGSIDGADRRAHPVHARPPADRRHRAVRVRPAGARVRVPPRAGLRERPARRRDQPRDAEDAVGAARGDGRAPGDRRRGHARACRRRSSSWRRRTRSSRRGRSRCPRRSSTASSSRPSSATRTPSRSSRSSAASARSIPINRLRARRRARRRRASCSTRSRTSTSTRVDPALDHRLSSRATREIDETVIGGSVRASLALERVARARALLDGRDFVQPADVEALFLPVLGHRVAFTPTFLAEARRLGRDEALAEFQTPVLRAGAASRARRRARAARPRHAGRERPCARASRLTRPSAPCRSCRDCGCSARRSARTRASAAVRARTSPGRGRISPATISTRSTGRRSARLSSAWQRDEFVVRDRQAEEMPRVVIVCDRRPEMALFPPELPWLHKPEATAWSVRLLAASAVNQRALVGYLDHASHEAEGAAGQPFWRPPRAQASGWHGDLVETLAGHVDGAARRAGGRPSTQALRFLGLLRGVVTVGSFVFVALGLPDRHLGGRMGRDRRARLGRRPGGHPGSGVGAQLPADRRRRDDLLGRGGRPFAPDRLTAGEVEQVRRRNEERRASVLETFAAAGLDYVDVSSGDPVSIHASFLRWADARLVHGGRLGDRAAPLAQRALGGGRRPRRARGRRRRGARRPRLVGRRRRHVRTGRDRRRDAPRATERPLRRPGRRDRQDRRRRA